MAQGLYRCSQGEGKGGLGGEGGDSRVDVEGGGGGGVGGEPALFASSQ